MFFVASVAYLFIGESVNPMAAISQKVQIIPSALLMTSAATGLWLVATFVFGRIYCSSVCPVGTLQDSASWLRRKLWRVNVRRRVVNPADGRLLFAPFRYRKSGRWGLAILLAYAVLLILGITSIATVIEPWNMFRSAARISNPAGAAQWHWLIFAGNVTAGAIFGIIVLVMVWLWALLYGRRFCNEICPIGTALGYVAERALYHIEIDPDKCTSCMRCEDVCKGECIKVVSRYVDNAKCVRCFDCLKVCDDNAIRIQRNRNRRMTPLFISKTQGAKN